MHIDCPHCHHPIDIVDVPAPTAQLRCPSCGSQWQSGVSFGAETQIAPSGRMVGRFRLLNLLGSGQFGEVWEAQDTKLDRRIALKIPRREQLDEGEIERFHREARAAGQLDHPNIVRVHEVGEADGILYIASDLVNGPNMADWIAAKRLLPFNEVAKLCATLADALQHAHDKKVIHRDLKPSNVLLDAEGQPHLTDFGLAKRESGEITMTVHGGILGTPAYMSPEQARGDAHSADGRSDVYSLGVILYELLTGEKPFQGNSRLLIHQVINDDPKPPRSVNNKIPRDLQTICLKAMEKDPARRYQTARDIENDLRQYISGGSISARPRNALERWGRWATRNRRLATAQIAATVLFGLLGVAVADALWQRKANAPVVHNVRISSEPKGARFVCVPVDPMTGKPLATKRVRGTALTPAVVQLTPGVYWIEAEIKGHGFHEVMRLVPDKLPPDRSKAVRSEYQHLSHEIEADGRTIALPSIVIPKSSVTEGMMQFSGGEIALTHPEPLVKMIEDEQRARQQAQAPSDPFPPASTSPLVQVAAFHLDPTEMTVGQCQALLPSIDPNIPSFKSRQKDDPMTYVNFDRAVWYAELAGKRLMTEEEYQYAATNGGETKYPWGDKWKEWKEWPLEGVQNQPLDQTTTSTPVFGLYSGVGEWTLSHPIPLPTDPNIPFNEAYRKLILNSRVIRGIPISVIQQVTGEDLDWGPRTRASAIINGTESPNVGFRCARSHAPRYLNP